MVEWTLVDVGGGGNDVEGQDSDLWTGLWLIQDNLCGKFMGCSAISAREGRGEK